MGLRGNAIATLVMRSTSRVTAGARGDQREEDVVLAFEGEEPVDSGRSELAGAPLRRVVAARSVRSVESRTSIARVGVGLEGVTRPSWRGLGPTLRSAPAWREDCGAD